METILKKTRTLFLVSLFAFATAFAGCTADTLTGVENEETIEAQADPATSQCRGSNCPNGHNL